MTTTTERYTAEQMIQRAEYLESPLSAPAYGECMRMAAMLRQAATDATRLQSLEAENARHKAALQWIVDDFADKSVAGLRLPVDYVTIARNALKED